MITIFSANCVTCGTNSVYVARVKKSHPDVKIVNTRVDKSRLYEHINYQKRADMGDTPQAIVVEDEGRVITLLREWKP